LPSRQVFFRCQDVAEQKAWCPLCITHHTPMTWQMPVLVAGWTGSARDPYPKAGFLCYSRQLSFTAGFDGAGAAARLVTLYPELTHDRQQIYSA
jgi:hypothetical protein